MSTFDSLYYSDRVERLDRSLYLVQLKRRHGHWDKVKTFFTYIKLDLQPMTTCIKSHDFFLLVFKTNNPMFCIEFVCLHTAINVEFQVICAYKITMHCATGVNVKNTMLSIATSEIDKLF